MMNNPEIVLAIWKSQYETGFALLDTPQEQIEFLKDLLLKNKENIIEAEKLPQFVPSDGQLTNQIKDEFAPHKPTLYIINYNINNLKSKRNKNKRSIITGF